MGGAASLPAPFLAGTLPAGLFLRRERPVKAAFHLAARWRPGRGWDAVPARAALVGARQGRTGLP
ncbi:hypothetical protein GCM10008959_06240 [Deinococcus seoulensis]|uniref:Transposase n=1 Tax=Deinococcus seoulensis TaxID=1837379 RepID=A0ABQ2RLT3_9DEIO|nr:hypothetical protein GCM10008959_06240 [Deinococcus seoulensis]